MLACGRRNKRSGAAFGRATPFVVSFVMALKGINIVAVNAILVLHAGKAGRRTVGRTPLRLRAPSSPGLHVWTDARADRRTNARADERSVGRTDVQTHGRTDFTITENGAAEL